MLQIGSTDGQKVTFSVNAVEAVQIKEQDVLKLVLQLSAEDEAKRDSLLRAADGFLRGNNQSLELRGTGLGESRRRESPNQFVQR